LQVEEVEHHLKKEEEEKDGRKKIKDSNR